MKEVDFDLILKNFKQRQKFNNFIKKILQDHQATNDHESPDHKEKIENLVLEYSPLSPDSPKKPVELIGTMDGRYLETNSEKQDNSLFGKTIAGVSEGSKQEPELQKSYFDGFRPEKVGTFTENQPNAQTADDKLLKN